MKGKYKLEYFEEAKTEYKELDGSQKVFVDKGLDRIKILGMQAGEPLHGQLEGCKKLKNRKMGLRIVFRQNKHKIQIIQIIAIGKRRRNEVYKNALDRLQNKDQIKDTKL